VIAFHRAAGTRASGPATFEGAEAAGSRLSRKMRSIQSKKQHPILICDEAHP
jgi:hypothetical protein